MSFAVCGLALLPVAVKADTFNFLASGSGFSASGTLSATSNGNGTYTINAVGGNGLSGPSAGLFLTMPDNLLSPGAARALDVNGFNFMDMIGGVSYLVNLYTDNSPSGFSYFADVYDSTGNLTEYTVNFSATAATPEPSSMVLLGTGLAAVMAFGVRRRLAV